MIEKKTESSADGAEASGSADEGRGTFCFNTELYNLEGPGTSLLTTFFNPSGGITGLGDMIFVILSTGGSSTVVL
jgi:hypothetical protein